MPNFSIALSGLKATNTALNVIGNNLANLNTTAYKAQTANFADLFYQNVGSTGTNTELQVGTGTKVQSIDTNFTNGTANSTGTATDLAIDGSGFFVVQDGKTQELTRAGNFKLDDTGNLLTTDGLSVMGYGVKNGAVDNSSSLIALNIPSGQTQVPKATTTVSFTDGLNSTSAVGTSVSASQAIYDSLGAPHEATVTYTKTAANTWTYAFTLPSGESSGSANATGTLSFNSDGTLAAPTANVAGIQFTGLSDNAANLNFTWSLYDSTGKATITQTDAAFSTNASSQDGYTSGTNTGFTVDSQGVVSATFTNGKTELLGQVAIASVGNEGGLSRVGDNIYKASEASGQIAIGVAGAGGRGIIDAKSLEGSNVDISTEFANLIVAQRAFEANSKTVTTFDTITQDTISMIR